MKDSQDPDFGATGQFELTGVYFTDKKVDAAFASTLGMDQIKSLVLLGMGPVHLQVLHELARQRRADLDVTLVTPWSHHVPAALLPAWVAGRLSAAQCQVDLAPLREAAGVRWIAARCDGLDVGTSSLLISHVAGASTQGAALPSVLSYHLLSIDTAHAGDLPPTGTTHSADHCLDIQRTGQFWTQWPATTQRLRALAAQRPTQPLQLAVVGSGAPAFEMVCALHEWAQTEGVKADLRLVTHAGPLLSDHPPNVRRRAHTTLQRLGIALLNAGGARVSPQDLRLDNGERLTSDLLLLALPAAVPQWLAHSGLALNGAGQVSTNAELQSTSHPNVLVVGPGSSTDSATATDHRNGCAELGAVLALNLRALASEQPLAPHPPRQRSLGFIDCGHGHAIAHWGPWSTEGQWAWRWKHKADVTYLTRQRSTSAA